MRLLRLLMLRSLRAHPLRILLSAFGIVLGVAAMVAIGITNLTAMDSVTRIFQDTSGKANLVLISADSTDKGFSEDIWYRAATFPGVAHAVPSVRLQTLLADDVGPAEIGFSFFGTSPGGLTLYGIDPALDAQVREYKLLAGRLFVSPTAYELVLVQEYADDKEIRVGQRVSILTPNGPQKLTVVGLLAKEGPGKINNGAFGVLPLQTAQDLFNRTGDLDQVDLVAGPSFQAADALARLKADLQARLGGRYSVIFPAAQGQRMSQMLTSYQIGLSFLSGIALFVGAFLIYNAFAMTVVERTREFGMLRTVGMTRRQVTAQVLAEAGLLGVLGSLVGAGFGVLMARGLTGLMQILLAQELSLTLAPDVMTTSVVVGVVTTLAAAAVPSWQAGRVSPMEALRVRGRGEEGWLVRRGWVLGVPLVGLSALALFANPFPGDRQFRLGNMAIFGLFCGAALLIPALAGPWEWMTRLLVRVFYGSSGGLGSRNIRRARLRTLLTVAALMVGVTMVLVVRGMTESFKADLVAWLNTYIAGDLYVGSSFRLRTDLGLRLDGVRGVAAAAPIRYFDVKWARTDGTTESLNFMAVDPLAYTRVTSFLFAQGETRSEAAIADLAAGDAVFISSVVAEKFGIRPGDLMPLKTRQGVVDFRVAAVVVDYFNQGLVVQGNWLDMRRYFGIANANAYLVKVSPGQSPEEVKARIAAEYGSSDHLTIESNQSIKQRVLVLMDQAFSLFDVLALIAVLIASLGIVNTLTMNVIERTQEIGMLRSVGMTRPQVLRMILAEAGLLGLLGGVLGLVLGALLARILLTAMTTMSGYRLAYIMSRQSLVLGLAIALFASHAAALWPAIRAARLRIFSAIQYE